MRLMHPCLAEPICFTENQIPVLVSENPVLFRSMVRDLCAQAEGGCGAFVLSRNYEVLDCARVLEVVVDHLHPGASSKKLSAKLTTALKRFAQQELQLETTEALEKLYGYIAMLCERFDHPLTFSQEMDMAPILKACGVRLDLEDGELGENLLDYLTACQALCAVECFVLVDLKAYLSAQELDLFYQAVQYRKLNVLVLESHTSVVWHPCEQVRLLDEDLCELALEKTEGRRYD